MAKQQNMNGQVVGGVNGNQSRYTYTTPDEIATSKGEKVRIVGLNQARFETLQNAGKEPDIPIRIVPTDLGEDQKEQLSENDLQNQEEREQWAEYKHKKALLDEKRSMNILRYVYDDGIIVDESKMEQWKQEEEEIYEIELPKNRIDLKVAYINSKIIGNADDLAEIMAAVMERTGVPPQLLDELRDSFRGSVRPSASPEVTEERSTENEVGVQ